MASASSQVPVGVHQNAISMSSAPVGDRHRHDQEHVADEMAEHERQQDQRADEPGTGPHQPRGRRDARCLKAGGENAFGAEAIVIDQDARPWRPSSRNITCSRAGLGRSVPFARAFAASALTSSNCQASIVRIAARSEPCSCCGRASIGKSAPGYSKRNRRRLDESPAMRHSVHAHAAPSSGASRHRRQMREVVAIARTKGRFSPARLATYGALR